MKSTRHVCGLSLDGFRNSRSTIPSLDVSQNIENIFVTKCLNIEHVIL